MNPDMSPIPLETLLANLDGMRRLAQRLVRDPALAEDVAQDAVLVALSKGPRHRSNLRGWLNGIVRNVARESQRSSSRRAQHEGAAPDRPEPPDPLSRAVQLAEQKRLLEAVASLSEPYRDAIWQRYFEGLSPRVMARRAGTSVDTVQTRLKRARALLRVQLDAAHGGDRRRWALALAPLAMAGTPWVLPTWIGGALVTMKTKVGLLAVLVLLASGAVWWGLAMDPSSEGEELTPRQTTGAEPGGDAGAAITLAGRESAGPPGPFPNEAGSLHLTGRTLDEAERPLSGVEIRMGAPEIEDVDQLRVIARSGADGRFALTLPPGTTDVRIVGRAAGRLDALTHIHFGGSNEQTPLILRLPQVATYVFRFLDPETDRPLAGVRCDLRRIESGRMWERTFRTNAEGLVSLPNPSADELGNRILVRVTHPGYRSLLQLDRPAHSRGYATASRPREVYLHQAPKLVLVAQDPEGRPVANARIRAWAGHPTLIRVAPEWSMATLRGWGSARGGSGVVLGDARSDDEGRVVFDAGPEGLAWFALAEGEGLLGLAHGGSSRRRGGRGIPIRMQATGNVVGRVIDGSGNPVSRARVECMPWYIAKRMRAGGRTPMPPDECWRLWRSMTNEAGEFEFLGLPLASAPAQLYVQAWRGDLGNAHSAVQAASGNQETQRFELVLESKHEVQDIQVVDEQGVPLAGALVTFANMNPGMLTNQAGVARLIRTPGVKGPYRAFKAGYLIGASENPPPEGELTIVLLRGHLLRGRVLDPDGRPHAAHVDVYVPGAADLPEAERRALFMGTSWYGRAQAGESGHFRLENIPAGPYFVRFWYSIRLGGAYRTVAGEQSVKGDAPVELVLPERESEAEQTGIVAGTVVDEEGRVLTSYSVGLRGAGRSPRSTLRGRRFRFEDVPAGEWTLKTSAEGGASNSELFLRVRPGETTQVRVVVGQALTLRGRLLDPAGKGLAGTYLQLFREGSSYSVGAFGATDADGRFEIKHLLAGRYRVRVQGHAEGASFCTSDAFFTLAAGSEQEHVFRAQPAGTLTLALDDDRFLPYSKDWHASRLSVARQFTSGAWLTVVTQSGDELRDWGLFHGEKLFGRPLAEGSYELVIKTNREGTFRTSFSVKAGQNTVVRIILEK